MKWNAGCGGGGGVGVWVCVCVCVEWGGGVQQQQQNRTWSGMEQRNVLTFSERTPTNFLGTEKVLKQKKKKKKKKNRNRSFILGTGMNSLT